MGMTLGPKAVQEIKQLIREFNAQYKNTAGHRARYTGARRQQAGGTSLKVAVLTTGMTAASTMIKGATFTPATPWTLDAADITTSVEGTTTIQICNMDEFGEADEGDLVLYETVSGYNLPVYISRRCPTQNEIIQFAILGKPTSGTFEFTQEIGGTPDSVTIQCTAHSSEVQTSLEGHSEIAAGQVICAGGPLPNATVTIEYTSDLGGINHDIPNFNWTNLAGGTGVGMYAIVVQQGHGDA